MRRLMIFGLLPAFLLLAAACSGSNDDGDDSGGGTEPPPATEAPATEAPANTATEAPANTATEAPANTATEAPAATEEPMDEPSVFAAVDGVTCSGDWTNLTFGSTGSFEAVFAVNVVVDAAADFLGTAKLRFSADGAAVDAVFEAPPFFGNDESKATIDAFAFDGSSLTAAVEIDFGDDRDPARSEITSSCS